MNAKDNELLEEFFKELRNTLADAIIKPLEAYKPKSVCPVCSGRGQVSSNFYRSYESAPFDTTGGAPIFPVTCRSCGGVGLV